MSACYGKAKINETVPPVPAPYQPEQDPQLRSVILAEYSEAVRAIDRKAKGMAYDRARRHRRTGREEVRFMLAVKHKLNETQARLIFPGL